MLYGLDRNQDRWSLLGVREETIAAHTEVSEECAREMAIGALHRLGSDIAVSATGLAGPADNGVSPVGTVFLGLAVRTRDADGERIDSFVRRLPLSPKRDRAYIRTVSASNALEMVLRAARGEMLLR